MEQLDKLVNDLTPVGELISPDQRLGLAPVSCGLDSRELGWDSICVEDYPDLPASDFQLPGMDHHLLVYHYKALDKKFYHECAGRKSEVNLRDGQFSFIPAGADNRWLFGPGSPSALHILVDRTKYNSLLEQDFRQWSIHSMKDDFQVTSERLECIAKLLWAELKLASGNQLYIDTLVAALSWQLNETFSTSDPPSASIPLRNISAARDFIHAEMANSVRLKDLAELCNLSQSQMVRSFKTRYGQTPYRYLIHCRIEKAKSDLLNRRDVPIAQLAYDLGFADQSHFTRQFRSLTGETPFEFKRHRTQ